ncbi:MAG: TerB family tellurite resistance protein [Cyclobacteriaceae bacterium]
MNASIRLKYLVQLALVDNTFDDEEMKFVVNLGRANNMSEEEINAIINEGLKRKDFKDEEFTGLSFDQRFEYLVSIIELMKVDGKIYLSEINYCKDIAERLGFRREIISRVTSKIHSDPSLSVDWNVLKDEIKKSEE